MMLNSLLTHKLKTFVSLLLSSFLLISTHSSADDTAQTLPSLLDINEWTVPWQNTRPRDPYVAPDGSVWFVGQVGNYVAKLVPETGEMNKFDIPDAGPHTVIVSDKGTPWYAGNKDKHIGKMNPETGNVTRFDMPEAVNDPHTMDWTSEGNLWFTAQWSGDAGYIGKLMVETGEVTLVKVPGKNRRPYGLKIDANDCPWIAFMGDNAIGTVDPDSMTLSIINTPTKDSLIRRLDITADGRIWWGDNAMGHIGVYDPKTETMREWKTPGGEAAGIYALVADNQDRIWYVETGIQPNRFVGFDSQTEKFISMDDVPSGGISIRHMVFDEPSNAIWFATDANTVGKAVVPD